MGARDERLYFRIQRTAHLLQKAADRRLLAVAGITTAQSAVLTILRGSRGATQRDVANALGINESGMTALVARLHKVGLITRTRSADDPRAWRLDVTEAGETTSRLATGAFEEINAMIDAVLDDADCSVMAQSMERIWRFAKP